MSYNGFMATQLLATKLFIPPQRPGIVPRLRLIKRLNNGLANGSKLTLISAPAGFGKTTLVSEWISSCGKPVAWLSLDDGDNDPVRFISYLIAALQTTKKEIGEGLLTTLQSPQPPPIESILTPLLNEITTISNHFIFILDDYHLMEAGQIDQAVTFLLDHLPPQMHLVIATREDPNLPLARLRARGQLTELRAADLRFTPAEAAEFLNQVMGLNLSADDIASLETRTEGWIAGLQLAALSMQGREDTASFIQAFTGSHRFVLDYLAEEVLHRQPEHIGNFLLQTSILERFCAPLCNAITEREDGKEMLDVLEHGNLFLIPLDDQRQWYRYHHLFAEVLQAHLKEAQSNQMFALHQQASSWFEQNHLPAEAFQHAFTANDFERAARLAEDAWREKERSFQTAAWLGWVKKLPEAVVCSHPRLCFQLGSAFSDAGEPEKSEAHLQNAERTLAGAIDQAEAKSLRVNIALIRANNAQIQGNLAETMRYAELAIQLTPKDDVYLRAQAVITLELIHWTTGNLESSLQAMYAWIEDMQRLGNRVFVIASAFAVADMQVAMGRLGEAEQTLRQAIQQAEAQGLEAVSITAHHHLGLAMLAHERGDEAETAQRLQIAADLGQRTTLVDWNHRWNLAQARLKESDREWAASLDLLDEAKRGYVKTAIPNLQPVEAHKARIYLKQGRLDKAQAWVQARSLLVRDEANYLGEYEHLTLARIRLAERSFEGVNPMLERLLALAETQKRIGSVIEILILQSLTHHAQGDEPRALAALEHALTLAEPEGYVRIFVDEGKTMQFLISDFRHLHRAADAVQVLTIEKQSREQDRKLISYADKILTVFPQSKIQNRKSKIVEPLSERELEVLKLLRSELSGPEIAERLIVSLNTLRTHTKNIFNKLGVNNRRSAIHRAEELDLF